jgi:hypothetical protein
MTAAYDQLERDAALVPSLRAKINDLYADVATLQRQRDALRLAVESLCEEAERAASFEDESQGLHYAYEPHVSAPRLRTALEATA